MRLPWTNSVPWALGAVPSPDSPEVTEIRDMLAKLEALPSGWAVQDIIIDDETGATAPYLSSDWGVAVAWPGEDFRIKEAAWAVLLRQYGLVGLEWRFPLRRPKITQAIAGTKALLAKALKKPKAAAPWGWMAALGVAVAYFAWPGKRRKR